MQAWQYLSGAAAPAPGVLSDTPASFFWISGAPLLFYAAWQLMYFFIVQAGFLSTPCRASIVGAGLYGHVLIAPVKPWLQSWSNVCCSPGQILAAVLIGEWCYGHGTGLLPRIHPAQWL